MSDAEQKIAALQAELAMTKRMLWQAVEASDGEIYIPREVMRAEPDGEVILINSEGADVLTIMEKGSVDPNPKIKF